MEFELSEDIKVLRASARSFLSEHVPKELVKRMSRDERGHIPDLWHEMAVLGWHGLLIPEEYGGSGGNLWQMCTLVEEMGRACLPGPFISSIGATLILLNASHQQKKDILPKIANGELIATHTLKGYLLQSDLDSIGLKATSHNNTYLISGTESCISDAHIADYIVCAAKTTISSQDVTLFLLASKNNQIRCDLLRTLSDRKNCTLVFCGTEAHNDQIIGVLDGGWSVIERVVPQLNIITCAEMLGGAEFVLDMTVDYAKQRTQSGHPIGSFQAVAHLVANMKIHLDHAKALIYRAIWALDKGLSAEVEVSMAKAYISKYYKVIALTGHQVHGAYAFQEDFPLHHYLKRAEEDQVTLGTIDNHLEIVATGLGLKSSREEDCSL